MKTRLQAQFTRSAPQMKTQVIFFIKNVELNPCNSRAWISCSYACNYRRVLRVRNPRKPGDSPKVTIMFEVVKVIPQYCIAHHYCA